MPQPPFKADQLSVDTTSGTGTRLINRNTTDDSLQFSDPVVSSALRLLDLVGVRNITGLALVGRAGDGAGYTTVQAAIDDAPITATTDEPHVILINSGRYEENLVIEKDGLVLLGLGGVTLANPTATTDATVTVQEGATVPLDVVLQNLRIENAEDGEECILVNGADTFASGTVTANTAPLAAGDTITIGGTALTGVSGARTSGNDDFSVDGTTTPDIATEIAAAINDSANSFDATVSATVISNVVTITADTAGAGGNSITLAVSTTPAGGLTASGGTLTGGGASPVMLTGALRVIDCDLIAGGVSSLQISVNIANNVEVRGGTWFGSSSTSKAFVSQCASFRLYGVEWTNDFEFAYDTGSTLPSILTSTYEVAHIARSGDWLVGLTGGVASLTVRAVSEAGTFTQGGDGTLDITHSVIGDLTLSDTTAATLVQSSRGTAAVGVGTPTLAENTLVGSVTWAGTSVSVVFDVPHPDASYAVLMEPPGPGLVPEITAKSTTGFTATATGASAATTFYSIARQL